MFKKRLGYYHSKDLDGRFSGAVLKFQYPDIELRGWDYKDPTPPIEDLQGYDEVILIDITFPFDKMIEYGRVLNLTVIDHHISVKREADEWLEFNTAFNGELQLPFTYIYDNELSACELGFKHYFGYVPPIVEAVGKYDTWRAFGTDLWDNVILPIKFYMYGKVGNPNDVNPEWFVNDEFTSGVKINEMISIGKSIMDYERKMDESRCKSYAFETNAFGLRVLAMNTPFFSSEVMRTMFDPEKHDIMVGFNYNGRNWGVNLRSPKGGADVSRIAKARGGGGHISAAGYESQTFEDIFKEEVNV